jgi:DNA polymerase bacteriophage-type
MREEMFVDCETTSRVDLKLHGLGRYLRDPSTRVNSWAYRLPGSDETQLWLVGDPFPQAVYRHIAECLPIVAHNALFDFSIWNEVFCRGNGAPKMQRSQMRCSAARARYNGLPGSLERACETMQLPIKKDTEGGKVMMQLATHPEWTPQTHPNEFAIQCAYNITDVDAMIGLWDATQPLPAREQAFYELDVLINARGFGVDVDAAQAMAELAEYAQALIDYQVAVATRGRVMASTEVEKIKDLAGSMGSELTDAGRETLKTLLEAKQLPPELHEILALRLDASRTPKKHLAILRAHVDGRMPYATIFHGALTGRDTAGGCGDVQLLNVARPRPGKSREDCEAILAAVKRRDKAYLAQPDVGPMLAAMADAQRQLFRATEPGHVLIAADLSGVEARMAAWLANDEEKLTDYENGIDGYKKTAAQVFGVPYEEVTKDQRQSGGKVPDLALTYGGGVGAFVSMGANYGVHLPEDRVTEIVTNWRAGRPAYERWWSMLEYAVLMALDQPGKPIDVPIGRGWCTKVTFVRDARALRMQLPSGRAISYHDARLRLEPGASVPVAVYLKPEGYYEQLDRKTLSNNLTQGMARDLFWEVMIDAERVERIVHRVYDEIILEVPQDRAQARCDALLARMKIPPTWAPNLPLGADGAISLSWGKD